MEKYKLRELQLLEYKMLKDVVKVCEDNNIKYFLTDGTLLGAVRHKGFIPWDDDIDIGMNLKNYKKFLKIAPKQLPKIYFIQNYKTDTKFLYPWTKIRVNGTTSMDSYLSNYDIHFGVCMDVFLYNGISKFKAKKIIQQKASIIRNVLLKKYYYLEGNINVSFSKKERFIYYHFPEQLRRLLIRMLSILINVNTSKCNHCYSYFYDNYEDAEIIESFWLKSFTKLKFEDDEFWTIKDYIKYLEVTYGDWKTPPPESQRIGHGDIIVDLENNYSKYWGDKLKKEKK